MGDPFVPDDFEVPVSFEGDGFRLDPLGPEHNERDHAAWMSSIYHIRSTPGFDHPEADWPTEMSLDANFDDVVGHARDFAQRTGFTYSVLDADEVIGCLYIYPSARRECDAEIRSWVTESRAEMDAVMRRDVSDWVEAVWPFEMPHYAPRR